MRLKKNILELTRYSIEEYREIEKEPILVLLDNVRSMHNVGSVLRTADSFGISGVILGGITGCPPHAEISKTALGAEESVEWRHVEDPLEFCKQLQAEGWTICVLEQVHDSVELQNYHRTKEEKVLLVAGNEVQGVDQRIVDIADIVLEIPQRGVKHSLNVSVSVGIAMWQLIQVSQVL